jgi:hypothetical protein
MKPERNLASLLLAHPEDSSMRYLYECMFGEPMPGTEANPLPAANVIPFPKRMSLGQRRKILRDAMQQLEGE